VTVEFRSAGTADALCISVLATQVFLDTYAIDGIRPSLAREVLEHLSVEAFTAHLSQPDARFIVAERAAHLIADVRAQPARASELYESYDEATRAAHAQYGHDGTIVKAQDPFAGLGIDTLELDGLATWPGAGPIA
jgi:hypothetical protein